MFPNRNIVLITLTISSPLPLKFLSVGARGVTYMNHSILSIPQSSCVKFDQCVPLYYSPSAKNKIFL